MDLRITTQHYVFKLHVSEDPEMHAITLQVGDSKNPCLLLNITTPSTQNERNERFAEFYNKTCSVARLSNIEALAECAHGDVTSNYMAKYSFGYELIQAIIFILVKKFPFVKKVQIDDRSYIPCNREFNQTVDLFTYSIAMQGVTWYEKVLNAYIEDKAKYSLYKSQIAQYVSRENKKSRTFNNIVYEITRNGTLFAKQQLRKHYEKWKFDFENSNTLPDFFKLIVDYVEYNEKCMLFKGWLQAFIGSQVTEHREWVFDIPVNLTATTSSTKPRKTRKNRRQ